MVIAPMLAAVALTAGPAPALDGGTVRTATAIAADPAAAQATVSIRDIVEMTDLSGLSVSPDGRWVAYRTEQPALDSNSYRMAWYVAPIDGSRAARRIADAGAAQFSDAGPVAEQTPIWSPRSNAIYFRSLVDGAVQVWRAAIDGSEARALTADPANVRDLALGSGGRTLVYHVGASRDALEHAEQAAYDDGILVDQSVDMAAPLSRGAFVDGRPVTQRFTGDWFSRGTLLWQTPTTTGTIALDSGDIVPPDAAAFPALSTPAGGVVRATIDFSNATRPLVANLADGRTVACDLAPCRAARAQAALVLADHRTVLVTLANVTVDQSLYLWEPAKGTMRLIASALGLLSGDREKGVPCAPAPQAVICVAANTTAPPRLVRVDVADGGITTLDDPNAALRARPALPSREIDWFDRLGDHHGGQLILPAGPPPPDGFPLVIDYYDCPGFRRGGLGDEVPMLPLASVGIAALCINALPSGAWDQLRNYDHALAGIEAILNRLAADHLIDPKRVGMTGLSFGSEVALTVAMRTRRLAAFALSSAQLDPILFWFNADPKRDYADTIRHAWGLGRPDTDPGPWQRQSPALNAEKITAPLLLQMPENEARTSMQWLTTMKIDQRPVELYAFPGEPHLKNQPRHKQAVYARNLDWFRFWLQGFEDPSPDKRDQYARWRMLAAQRDRTAAGEHLAYP